MIRLETPLSQIPAIGLKFLRRLENLKIKTVKDLILHFPTRYEDFSQIYKIADLEPHQEATIRGIIKEVGGRRTWRHRLYLVEALISDETGSIRAVWFNQPYIKNVLRPGCIANFSGKVTLREDEFYLSNPTYELLTSKNLERPTTHTARIVPIYPETKGLTSKGLRYLIKLLLARIEKIKEVIPQEILKKEGLPEVNTAISQIHFPSNLDEAIRAKKRFALEDLLLLQIYNIKQRMQLAREKAVPLKIEVNEIKKIINALPFELSRSQKQSLWEIVQDLRRARPMNRLLQGDVGSGKTIVAAIAAILTAQQGYESAFMAPTEILARQHFETLKKFFPDFDLGIALLTGSEAKIFYGGGLETETKKHNLLKEIALGKIKIVIGTHALIHPVGISKSFGSDLDSSIGDATKNNSNGAGEISNRARKNVTFKNLAFVVVDEQHRFGVEQRRALLKNHESGITNKGDKQPLIHNSKFIIPHFLSMSATPIPRTLSLTLFGDLDLSLITELPKNRKPIITKVVSPENRNKAYAFIREQIKRGRQAFVICPRIEPGKVRPPKIDDNAWKSNLQKLELKSVKDEYEKLSKKVFPDLRVAMLHGKMSAKEKENTMRDFNNKKIDILVSTSVVEVGVDIPNATIMMVEGADRFGLAQLYQFRGRVGRGAHQSYCLLFTDSSSASTHQRLKSIVEAKNGFELAEKDLAIRGPGEFLGTAQTGMPDLAMKALQNPELVKRAREAALQILQKDKTLKRYPLLLARLDEFQKEIHWE